MNEKVVVSQSVPQFMPKLENPIYKFALEQKAKLRCEVINRIKCGTFENGIAPLYELVNGLTREEMVDILNYWRANDNKLLLYWYLYPFRECDIEKIKKADEGYMFKLANDKENLGRK